MDLKELNKLIQLCRKHGVLTIKIEGIELTLSEESPSPAKPTGKSASKTISVESRDPKELEGELDQESLLFWSSNHTQILETPGDQ